MSHLGISHAMRTFGVVVLQLCLSGPTQAVALVNEVANEHVPEPWKTPAGSIKPQWVRVKEEQEKREKQQAAQDKKGGNTSFKSFIHNQVDAIKREAKRNEQQKALALYMQRQEEHAREEVEEQEKEAKRQKEKAKIQHDNKIYQDILKQTKEKEKLERLKLSAARKVKKDFIQDGRNGVKLAKIENRAIEWAKVHYKIAPAGKKCPRGFKPINDRMHCKLAQEALGGVDDLDLVRVWEQRPGGCYMHNSNKHVNFNSLDGQLNNDDSRICEMRMRNKVPGGVFDSGGDAPLA